MAISKYTQLAVSFVILAAMVLNWLYVRDEVTGLIVGTMYMVFFSFRIGKQIFKNESFLWQFFWGMLCLISVIILFGTIVYFVFGLLTPKPHAVLILVGIVTAFFSGKKWILRIPKINTRRLPIFLTVLYALCAIVLYYWLLSTATYEAVRGPWAVLTKHFVLLYGLLTLLWLALLYRTRSSTIVIAASLIHFFLTSGIALILFPVGFGFDSFLHRAAEKTILTDGFILPKTFYYIGQYALLVHIHYLTSIPIDILDKLLLPVTFSVFTPALMYAVVRTYHGHRIAALTLPLALTVPLTYFTQTTPQGLSIFYVIISIVWFLVVNRTPSKTNVGIQIFLLIVTMSIHPLSGIALALWLSLVFFFNHVKRRDYSLHKKNFLWGAAVLGSTGIFPMVFLITPLFGSPLAARIRIPHLSEFALTNIFSLKTFDFIRQFNIIFDFIYLYRFNWTLILIVVGGIGVFINRKKQYLPNTLFSGFAVIFLNSVAVALFISFESLIFYERSDFAERLYGISILFLLPFAMVSTITFIAKVRNHAYGYILISVILSAVITSAMYISYPRYDAYERIRTFNTSKYDIDAVRAIENDAAGEPYVVLANQAVSAAAVKEFGFKAYYNDTFFYPLPTGGDLYTHYLAIVEGGNPAHMEALAAHELTNINIVYFVLNNYWFNSDETRENALRENSNIIDIANGTTTIFKYTF